MIEWPLTHGSQIYHQSIIIQSIAISSLYILLSGMLQQLEKAWLSVPSQATKNDFISVIVLERVTPETSLIIQEFKFNQSNPNLNKKQAYAVRDQLLTPQSRTKQLEDAVDIQYCNPPELQNLLKKSDKKGIQLIKIGHNCLVDCQPTRSLRYSNESEVEKIRNYFRYHIQSLLGSNQSTRKQIVISGNSPYPHQYLFILFSYLNENKQLWPYKININHLQGIIEKLLGGVSLEIRLGYLMDNRNQLRQTHYIYFKPYRAVVDPTLWIPRYLLDLVNNQQCQANFYAPKPSKNQTSNQQIKQMIGCLFGVGFSGSQINQLMKILSAIANLNRMTIMADQQCKYPAFRLVDQGPEPKTQTQQFLFRFCLLTGMKESDFHSFIFYNEQQSGMLDSQNVLNNAQLRLRVLEYCLYEKYIEFVCQTLNQKLRSKRGTKILEQTAIKYGNFSIQDSNHKIMTVYSDLIQEQSFKLIHPDTQHLRQCKNGYQSIKKSLDVLTKANLIKSLRRSQDSSLITKDILEGLTLNQFMNPLERIWMLERIAAKQNQGYFYREVFRRQKQINHIYTEIKKTGVPGQALETLTGTYPVVSVSEVPNTIKDLLWQCTNFNQQSLIEVLQTLKSEQNKFQQFSYQDIINFESDPKKSQPAFILTNDYLLSDRFLMKQLITTIIHMQNMKHRTFEESICMEISSFAERYKYTEHLKQQVHRKHSTKLTLQKQSKLHPTKKVTAYKYTYYEDNESSNSQLAKKIINFVLEEGTSDYELKSETSPDKKTKKFIVCITDIPFFNKVEEQVQHQNKAKQYIWEKYRFHKLRQKTNSIVRRNQRIKKLPKLLMQKFGKDRYFRMIKYKAFCEMLRSVFKISLYRKLLKNSLDTMRQVAFARKFQSTANKLFKSNKMFAIKNIIGFSENQKKLNASPNKPPLPANKSVTQSPIKPSSPDKPLENKSPIPPNKSVTQSPIKPSSPDKPLENKSPIPPNNSIAQSPIKPSSPDKPLDKKVSLSSSKPGASQKKKLDIKPTNNNSSAKPIDKLPTTSTDKKPVNKLNDNKASASSKPSTSQTKLNTSTTNPPAKKPAQNKSLSKSVVNNPNKKLDPPIKMGKSNYPFPIGKKAQNYEQLTKLQLDSIKDFPKYSLEVWESKSLLKSEKFNSYIKAIQSMHRSSTILEIPPASEELAISPDKQIQSMIEKSDYRAFARVNCNYNTQKPGDFQRVIQCQVNQISHPLLKIYPIKQYPDSFKDTFNAILKIGQHKNSSKTMDYLLNQTISPILKYANSQQIGQHPIAYDYQSPHNIIKDQIFLQISKQITNNKDIESVIRLLHCLSILTRYYSPSHILIYAYLNHFQKISTELINLKDSKSVSRKAISSLLEAILENLLLFVEAYERSLKKKVMVFKPDKKQLEKKQIEYIEYLGLRKHIICSAEVNIGENRFDTKKSVTPSKMNFSQLGTSPSLIKSSPYQCIVRLLNNVPFSFFVRNQSVRTIKRKILAQIGFLNKQDCFALYLFKKGNLYYEIEDHSKLIDFAFNEKQEHEDIFLRIKYYFPYSIQEPNATRLTFLNLISEQVTWPWYYKDYEFLVVQSMMQGQFEELRVNNYLFFSNQLKQKKPDMNSIKQLYGKESADTREKIYHLQYMKYIKEKHLFLLKCYRKKSDPKFRIGVKPYEILIYHQLTAVCSMDMQRVKNVYVEQQNVVIQVEFVDTVSKKEGKMMKKYTITDMFRPRQLYENIRHYLINKS